MKIMKHAHDTLSDASVAPDHAATANHLPEEWTGHFQTVQLMPEDAEVMIEPVGTRQRDILGMATLGIPNYEIGSRLFIAESTVKSHMVEASRAIGVRTRLAARSVAFASGLIMRALETDQLPRTREVLEDNALDAAEVEIMRDHELTINDYRLLTLTAGGLNMADVADVFHIELSSMKSRAHLLYKRLGVGGMKEAHEKLGIIPID